MVNYTTISSNNQQGNDNSDSELRFHEALSFIIESATINSGSVTLDEIHQAFDGILPDDSMYQLVYNYLLENQIKIEGYIPMTTHTGLSNHAANSAILTEDHDKTPVPTKNFDRLQAEEAKIVDMYRKDTSDISHLDRTKITESVKALISGQLSDSNKHGITNTLTEQFLDHVIALSASFENHGVTTADLIQEGNLGLIEGIHTFSTTAADPNPVCDEAFYQLFLEHIDCCIHRAFHDAIEEQNASNRLGSRISDHANRLDAASIELTETLGRTPTIAELAKHLSLPEDEVERIMKMSLDALNSDGTE